MSVDAKLEIINLFKNLSDLNRREVLYSLVTELDFEDLRTLRNHISHIRKNNPILNFPRTPADPSKYYAIDITKIKTYNRTNQDAGHVVLVDQANNIVFNTKVRHAKDLIVSTHRKNSGLNPDHFVRGLDKFTIKRELRKIIGPNLLIGFALDIQLLSLDTTSTIEEFCLFDFHSIFRRPSSINNTVFEPIGQRHVIKHFFDLDILSGPQSAILNAKMTMRLYNEVYLKMKNNPELIQRENLRIMRLPKPPRANFKKKPDSQGKNQEPLPHHTSGVIPNACHPTSAQTLPQVNFPSGIPQMNTTNTRPITHQLFPPGYTLMGQPVIRQQLMQPQPPQPMQCFVIGNQGVAPTING